MLQRLIRWLIFSVIVALLPLAFNAFMILVTGKELSLLLICSNGELLIISAAISAAAIGELFSSNYPHQIPKYLAGGGCVISLCVASLMFAYIAGAAKSNVTLEGQVILNSSLIMFIFAILSSGSCIAIAENQWHQN